MDFKEIFVEKKLMVNNFKSMYSISMIFCINLMSPSPFLLCQNFFSHVRRTSIVHCS